MNAPHDWLADLAASLLKATTGQDIRDGETPAGTPPMTFLCFTGRQDLRGTEQHYEFDAHDAETPGRVGMWLVLDLRKGQTYLDNGHNRVSPVWVLHAARTRRP